MISTINICDNEYQYSTSFGFMLKYKSQFKEDVAGIIIDAVSASQTDETGLAAIAKIGFVNIARIAWSCIAVCDKTIEPFDKWIEKFDEFPVLQVATEMLPNIFSSLSSKKK